VTIKAILDTNVIVSVVFWKGAPFEILEAWQKRRFLLAISLPILSEYRRVLVEMTKKRNVVTLGAWLRWRSKSRVWPDWSSKKSQGTARKKSLVNLAKIGDQFFAGSNIP